MPDIDFYYDQELTREHGGFTVNDGNSVISAQYVRDLIKPIVAEQMDCLDLSGQPVVHRPEQIKFLSFAPFPDSGDAALVAMRVYAFDWPDRMSNLNIRLENIGDGVAGALALPKKTVDVSFIELRHPTEAQHPGWVRV